MRATRWGRALSWSLPSMWRENASTTARNDPSGAPTSCATANRCVICGGAQGRQNGRLPGTAPLKHQPSRIGQARASASTPTAADADALTGGDTRSAAPS